MTGTEKPFYLVETDHGPKCGRAWNETYIGPHSTDEGQLVREIAGGHYSVATRVLRIDIAAGTVRDVSSEIGAKVADAVIASGITSSENTATIYSLTGWCSAAVSLLEAAE